MGSDYKRPDLKEMLERMIIGYQIAKDRGLTLNQCVEITAEEIEKDISEQIAAREREVAEEVKKQKISPASGDAEKYDFDRWYCKGWNNAIEYISHYLQPEAEGRAHE
jgi:hypothetical protein